MNNVPVGIVGIGVYLPDNYMTAKEISEATGGTWSEDAVINKLGIRQKRIPSDKPCDGTQEMGALAALDCLKNTGIDPIGTHIMSDGSVVHTCGSKVGGIVEPVTAENVSEFGMLRLMDSPKMKGMLNSTSMPNWYHCIDEALRKSGMTRKDIGYLDILHIKRSGHKAMLADLGLTEDQTIYLEDYGHIGQVDQILSLKLALEQGKVKDGTVISMIAAGIGYTWAANVIKWG